VIRAAWRRVVRFLGSAALALGLLVFLGVWSAVATVIPQADASGAQLAAWVSAHLALEPVVGVLGLHQAYSAPIFVACVAQLMLCTSLCAWRRTKVAMSRSRALRVADSSDHAAVVAKHDIEIACGPAFDGARVLIVATEILSGLGFRLRRKGELATSVSPVWSVWGSPVFHWALVGFAVVVLLGTLQRSSGLMGLATGQTKPDALASYGVVQAGPLRDWSTVHRSFRVDSLEPDFRIGNLDYGPAPTVSVLDGAGNVIKTQRVYPNMPLQVGSLTIHAPAFGLAATLSLVATGGIQVARGIELIDFSNEATGGTIPAGDLVMADRNGAPELRISTSVPLDRAGGGYAQALPTAPTAHVVIMTMDGHVVQDVVATPGDSIALPMGGVLRLEAIGWYSRLSVVDDSTVPFMYLVLAVAAIGLAVVAFARQQYVLAAVVDGPEGTKLMLSARLWRNSPTTRERMVEALTEALGTAEEGSDS
jgi:hypothetical protein